MFLKILFFQVFVSSFSTHINLQDYPNPDIIGNVTDKTLSKFFDKKLNIFGVIIYGEINLPEWMMKHAGHIMAQYLDYTADGVPNNIHVLKSMLKNQATLVMFNNPDSIKADRAMRALEKKGLEYVQDLDKTDIPNWVPHFINNNTTYKALFGNQINPCVHTSEKAKQHCEEAKQNGIITNVGADDFDASLEEIFHLITDAGYSNYYEDDLATEAGSNMMDTMDKMVGDCGWAFNDTMKYPHCSGHYHYGDETCDYECLGTEYFMWSITSILGGQDGSHNDALSSRCDDISDEWEMCTPRKMAFLNPDATGLFDIFGQNPFLLPNILPDGHYNVKTTKLSS